MDKIIMPKIIVDEIDKNMSEIKKQLSNLSDFVFNDYKSMVQNKGYDIYGVCVEIQLVEEMNTCKEVEVVGKDLFIDVYDSKLRLFARRDFERFKELFPAQYIVEGQNNQMEVYGLHVRRVQAPKATPSQRYEDLTGRIADAQVLGDVLKQFNSSLKNQQ